MTPLWTSADIAQAVSGTASAAFDANGVAFDSREVTSGDLFIALSGETTDGRFVGSSMAEVVSNTAFVNTSVDVINQRILGRYQNGLGKTWDDPNYMKFFNDGAVTFPYLSDGMWFLTQHKRWGLLKADVDYLAVAKQINQIDLYKEAAAQVKVSVPKEPMRTSKLIDGTVWDGKDPKKYADSFKIRA